MVLCWINASVPGLSWLVGLSILRVEWRTSILDIQRRFAEFQFCSGCLGGFKNRQLNFPVADLQFKHGLVFHTQDLVFLYCSVRRLDLARFSRRAATCRGLVMSDLLNCNSNASHCNGMPACNQNKYLTGPFCPTILVGNNGAMVACFGFGFSIMPGWRASCHASESVHSCLRMGFFEIAVELLPILRVFSFSR